ncbi:hypothetical protein [Pelomonas cellulosilytica]|uniref:Transposase n=1 Tax=Pelomonas cellulosilytica TaxID=2906762 RepID=A0ABS8XY86_9BURK|nr:hypothetical protein [Pelomonas sp. P8]MCE4555576.1 hypothetical protein [Pelomonas sp. P8]
MREGGETKRTHGHSYATAQLLSEMPGNTEGRRGAYPRTFVSHAMKHGKKSVRESIFTLALMAVASRSIKAMLAKDGLQCALTFVA